MFNTALVPLDLILRSSNPVHIAQPSSEAFFKYYPQIHASVFKTPRPVELPN